MMYSTGLVKTTDLTLCCNLKVRRSLVSQDFCVSIELFLAVGPWMSFFDLYSLNCLEGTEIVNLGSILL